MRSLIPIDFFFLSFSSLPKVKRNCLSRMLMEQGEGQKKQELPPTRTANESRVSRERWKEGRGSERNKVHTRACAPEGRIRPCRSVEQLTFKKKPTGSHSAGYKGKMREGSCR